jgi:hypothetical protein
MVGVLAQPKMGGGAGLEPVGGRCHGGAVARGSGQ